MLEITIEGNLCREEATPSERVLLGGVEHRTFSACWAYVSTIPILTQPRVFFSHRGQSSALCSAPAQRFIWSTLAPLGRICRMSAGAVQCNGVI